MAEPALSRRAHPGPAAFARPDLSILVPTYNRARFMRRSLAHHLNGFATTGLSVAMQVSDNGSTDGTGEALAEWAGHAGLEVVRQPENVGAYGNVLFSFRSARGRYAAYVGDDDLLIPERVAAAIAYMDAHPEVVMFQAPWLLVDETQGNAVTGQFYQLDGPVTFPRGAHADCLDLLLARHVFPESFILRTDAIPAIIGPLHEHAFVFFTQLGRALDVGAVHFSPEPLALMTAVTAGDNTHAGNSEVMTGWDRYRGGLEHLLARARETQGSRLPDMPTLLVRLQQFVCQRMAVAVRLHLGQRNWRDAHCLARRLAAYGVALPPMPEMEHLQSLAALETAFAEAAMLKRGLVVLDSRIPHMFVEALNPARLPPIARPGTKEAAAPGPKAHVMLGTDRPAALGPDDIVIDLAALIAQHG